MQVRYKVSVLHSCIVLVGIIFMVNIPLQAQPNNNGALDNIEEFTTKFTVPFTMPDGVKLMTDVYLPIIQDELSSAVDDTLDLIVGKFPVQGNLTIWKKGTQIVIYDTLNGQPLTGADRYQLPLIFTRTPYNKQGNANLQAIFGLIGFAQATQDLRGRYSSEGVYFPMYSDGWNKNAYHPDFSFNTDLTNSTDPKNSNRHEDGYNSIQYIVDSLRVPNSLNLPHSGMLLCNGSVGMFGASALGNTQLQAAAAHRIDPNGPGLKGIMPIVATLEHYDATIFPNGVFRERIVTGWVKGQLTDLDDPEDLALLNPPVFDIDMHDTVHTALDYNLAHKFEVGERSIDNVCCEVNNGLSPYSPVSIARMDMDGSRALVDANGESVAGDGITPLTGLTNSRYNNMQVSCYHLTGWWDIYPEGQIQTFLNQRAALSSDSLLNMQKIVIGPWAHETIGTRKTGDRWFPKNVLDVTRLQADEDVEFEKLSLNDIFKSEIFGWYRYTLNRNNWKTTSDPKFIIPESSEYQDLGSMYVRMPSKDYVLNFEELFNYLNGTTGLGNMDVEFVFQPPYDSLFDTVNITLADGIVPATGNSVLDQLDTTKVTGVISPDFYSEIPAVRFWVVGNDSADRASSGVNAGDYWFGTNTFPLDSGVKTTKMYLHKNGSLNFMQPSIDEGNEIYQHDPDDPVVTCGGGNMIVTVPDGSRDSQGPMDLTNPEWKHLTMNHKGVIQYESNEITQANGYSGDSLCIIGYPVATIQAQTSHGSAFNGPTNTEFYVRILDVYPDGREYFVTEGGVNARAREYARSIAEGNKNINAPFSNIEIGKWYEYKFQLMPIAHTFAKGHKIKILISSSNHPRYQSCPNIPIEDGEFFRRYPNDGRKYTYNGQEFAPRVAIQRINFSSAFGANSTNIELPVYDGVSTVAIPKTKTQIKPLVYPNPNNGNFLVVMNRLSKYEMRLFTVLGQQVMTEDFSDRLVVDISGITPGIYFMEVIDETSRERAISKIIVQDD